jgi:hypothetical protein
MLIRDYLRDINSAYGDWLPGLKLLMLQHLLTVTKLSVLLEAFGSEPAAISSFAP